MARTRRSKLSNTKTFVLDTNVLLHNPNSLFSFAEHNVYIPFVTLEELDKHKVGHQDINRNAREATRHLEQVSSQPGPFEHGFPLESFNGKQATGRLFLQTGAVEDELVGAGAPNDNRFLRVVGHLQKEGEHGSVTLVTKDLNLRIKARACGYAVDDYKNDHVVEDSDLLYKGFREAPTIFDDAGDTLESWKRDEHVYYRVKQHASEPYRENELLSLPDGQLAVVSEGGSESVTLKSIRNYQNPKNSVFGIKAESDEQAFALHLLMNPEIDFVTLLGPAGTGKTLLTLAAALEQTMEPGSRRFDRIVYTRATVPFGEDIGFLPGTEQEKMKPWMGALEDNLDVLLKGAKGRDQWEKSVNQDMVSRFIDCKSMMFMRGRTFVDTFLIVDEAQNLTPKQMKTLTTRAGIGTKVVCLGNLNQIDTPYVSEHSSGLAVAVERFRGFKHGGHVILRKGERSRLADYANDHL